MAHFESVAEALKSRSGMRERLESTPAARLHWLSHMSEWALFTHDLVVLNVILCVVAWWLGVFSEGALFQNIDFLVFLPLLSFAIISFFFSEELYSYHVLFCSKVHISRAIRAFSWGFITIFIFFVFQWWPEILETWKGLGLIFCLGVVCTLVSRFVQFDLTNFVKSLGVSFLAIGCVGLLVGEQKPSFVEHWGEVFVAMVLAAGVLLVTRLFLVHFVFQKLMRRYFRRQIVIVGSDEESKRVTDHVVGYNAPFWIVGFVGVEKVLRAETAVPKRALGSLKDLPDIVRENGIDEIIVTDKEIEKSLLVSLLEYCTSEGIVVWFPPKLLPIINMKLRINRFCDLPMVKLCSRRRNCVLDAMERSVDILVALTILLLFLPFFFLLAIAVKLSSPGPVFYRAKAIGRNAKEFTMYKFRSMKEGGASDIHRGFVTKLIKGEIKPENEGNKPLKICDDSRVTPVGRLLRNLSLDELPQVINVIKGDMSLVGPRPCLPYEYEVYDGWHKQRTIVRPGITGLWQVAGRSSVAFDDMILLDLYYIYNRDLLMYMNVLYETIFAVLEKRGAY